MSNDAGEITRLLAAARDGDQEASERVMAYVYEELRRLAGAYMRREQPGHTLQPTALVHEAYIRLVHTDNLDWQNRAHFLAVAARVMRRILVDHARMRQSLKRGGYKVELNTDVPGGVDRQAEEVMDLNSALEDLFQLDERLGRIVELRYFGGLSAEETAKVLGVSSKTVKRDWVVAKAWLKERLDGHATKSETLA